jgi:hypothetical protein
MPQRNFENQKALIDYAEQNGLVYVNSPGYGPCIGQPSGDQCRRLAPPECLGNPDSLRSGRAVTAEDFRIEHSFNATGADCCGYRDGNAFSAVAPRERPACSTVRAPGPNVQADWFELPSTAHYIAREQRRGPRFAKRSGPPSSLDVSRMEPGTGFQDWRSQ